MKTFIISVILTAGICLPSTLIGQDANEEFIHGGFFMRFLVGKGPGSVDIDNQMTLKSSPGNLFHFQMGGEISENLALFGDIGGFYLSDPEMRWDGATATLTGASVNILGLGAGLSYYIMPANMCISGSLMLTRTTIEYQGQEFAESKTGPGVFLSIGKEWRVGQKWGLGIAGFFESAWLKDKEDAQGYQADMNNQIYGIAFSATMF